MSRGGFTADECFALGYGIKELKLAK